MIDIKTLVDGDKVVCINEDNQSVLKLGCTYTVDLTKTPYGGRFYIKEWQRFAFKADRFILLKEGFK